MAWPIVIATNGFGIPVTESANGTPYEIAANGYGMPVVFVAFATFEIIYPDGSTVTTFYGVGAN